MPRAGLTGHDVVAAAAGLSDEIGYDDLTMGLLAQRLGVRAPSLYKHFQWTGSPDESFDWMIRFIDRGLRAPAARSRPAG